MELIINISEQEYNECKNLFNMVYQEGYLNYNLNTSLIMYIANGIPLPKGHGDLIDREQILQGEHFVVLGDVKAGDKNFGEREIDMFPKQAIMSVKPIIEADGGE